MGGAPLRKKALRTDLLTCEDARELSLPNRAWELDRLCIRAFGTRGSEDAGIGRRGDREIRGRAPDGTFSRSCRHDRLVTLRAGRAAPRDFRDFWSLQYTSHGDVQPLSPDVMDRAMEGTFSGS